MPAKRKNETQCRCKGDCEHKNNKSIYQPIPIVDSIPDAFLFMFKRFLFYNVNFKVALYLGVVFGVSVIADLVTFPKTYMSRPDNFFNKYFAKYAWEWNLLLLVPFVILTSYIYSLCNVLVVIRYHLSRLVFATIFMFTWKNLFIEIEAKFGQCTRSTYTNKSQCLKAGYFWLGMDISENIFILIYGSLLIIEEIRYILKWDTIKQLIHRENHFRTVSKSKTTWQFVNLKREDFFYLKDTFDRWSPIIKLLFLILLLLQFIWDVLLICTILYYENILEKFLGGFLAIFTWFITYRLLYGSCRLFPQSPPNNYFINPIEISKYYNY